MHFEWPAWRICHVTIHTFVSKLRWKCTKPYGHLWAPDRVVSWATVSWNPGLAHEIEDLFFLNGDWRACCDAETDQFGSLQGGHISYLCCICWWGGILCLGLGCQAFNAPCWFDPTSLVPHLARITSKLPKPWLSRSVGIIIPNMVEHETCFKLPRSSDCMIWA